MKIEHKDRGWKVTQDNGEIVYIGEYGTLGLCDGVIYKDYNAFYNGDENEVCYINEYGFENSEENAGELFEFEAKQNVASLIESNPYMSRFGYTRKDFISMCNGDKELAEELFEDCAWQCAETRLDELLDEAEDEDFE